MYVASLSRGAGKRGFYAGVNAFVRAVDWSVENGPSGCLKHACSFGHYAFPVPRKSADVIERLNDTVSADNIKKKKPREIAFDLVDWY